MGNLRVAYTKVIASFRWQSEKIDLDYVQCPLPSHLFDGETFQPILRPGKFPEIDHLFLLSRLAITCTLTLVLLIT
jgi:hypothetical protein